MQQVVVQLVSLPSHHVMQLSSIKTVWMCTVILLSVRLTLVSSPG